MRAPRLFRTLLQLFALFGLFAAIAAHGGPTPPDAERARADIAALRARATP